MWCVWGNHINHINIEILCQFVFTFQPFAGIDKYIVSLELQLY